MNKIPESAVSSTVNKVSYTITTKQNLLSLGPLLGTNLTLASIDLYFFGFHVTIPLFYYVFIFRLVTDILPVIILHSQYLLINIKSTLTIDPFGKELSYEDRHTNIVTTFDNISSLHYYASYGRGTGWYLFESYRYFKIVIKDHTEIIITCLMVNRIEKNIHALLGIKAEKHLRVLALVK